MPSASEIAGTHVEAALAEAGRSNISEEALGRALLDQAVAILGRARSPQEIADELTFLANNIVGDEEYGFMRP